MMTAKYADEYVRKLALRFAASRACDADDVAQELRIGWWKAERAGYAGPLGVHFALRRLRVGLARRENLVRNRPGVMEALAYHFHVSNLGADPEMCACVRKMASVLSPPHLEVLCATAEGKDCAEIARERGISRTTAWRLLQAARESAREALGG